MHAFAIAPTASAELPALVTAIGSDAFGSRLLDYLHETCGADHCALFRLGPGPLRELTAESLDGTSEARDRASLYIGGQYWRKDPAIAEAKARVAEARPALIRVDVGTLADSGLREAIYPRIRERLVLCGRHCDDAFGLSILRSDLNGAFSDDQIGRLSSVADLLVALLARHCDLLLHRLDLARALATLADTERCLVEKTSLPRRELEVCARVLHGLSTAGIALDLAVGEESVKTYRKRAYRRLNITSERELLTWYLALWSH